MEHLHIVMSCGEDHFFARSCDAEMFIHCLGDYDFRIVEHNPHEDSLGKSLITEEMILEEKESGYVPWYSTKQDSNLIYEWLEDGKFSFAESYKIIFKLGGSISYCVGEFHYETPPNESAKSAAIKILSCYGYEAPEEIWRLIRHFSGYLVRLDNGFFLTNKNDAIRIVDRMISNNEIVREHEAQEEQFRRMEEELERRKKEGEILTKMGDFSSFFEPRQNKDDDET
jgi:hypothetical protein